MFVLCEKKKKNHENISSATFHLFQEIFNKSFFFKRSPCTLKNVFNSLWSKISLNLNQIKKMVLFTSEQNKKK